ATTNRRGFASATNGRPRPAMKISRKRPWSRSISRSQHRNHARSHTGTDHAAPRTWSLLPAPRPAAPTTPPAAPAPATARPPARRSRVRGNARARDQFPAASTATTAAPTRAPTTQPAAPGPSFPPPGPPPSQPLRLRQPQRLQVQPLARAAFAPLHVQRQQHQPRRARLDRVAPTLCRVDVRLDLQCPPVAAVLELAVATAALQRLADADLVEQCLCMQRRAAGVGRIAHLARRPRQRAQQPGQRDAEHGEGDDDVDEGETALTGDRGRPSARHGIALPQRTGTRATCVDTSATDVHFPVPAHRSAPARSSVTSPVSHATSTFHAAPSRPICTRPPVEAPSSKNRIAPVPACGCTWRAPVKLTSSPPGMVLWRPFGAC